KTRCLWLTDHKYLNDPSEIAHGKKILLDCIDGHLQQYVALNHYLKYLINKIIENCYKTYIVSFCEKEDIFLLGDITAIMELAFLLDLKKIILILVTRLQMKTQPS